jgi:hypothetical protein
VRSKRVPIATLLALAFAVMVTPAQAAFPGTNGKIGFASSASGFSTVAPDGGDLVFLALGGWPSFSADGRKIVYSGNTGGNSGVRRMNFDGTGDVPIFNPDLGHPSWSPDGSKIVVDGVSVMNADGTGLHFVTGGYEPEWSPDGSRLVFTQIPPGGSNENVYTSNSDGTGVTNLTADIPAASRDAPTWSPDGSKIAYVSRPFTGGQDLYVMNANGTGKALLRSFAHSPAWSPDGTKIAYKSGSSLHVMGTDGSNDVAIASVTAGYEGTDWQPCPAACPAPAVVDYDVPSVATQAYIKFVPNFRQTISDTQCTSRGGAPSSHGPPLSLSSCNPPAYLPGTVAHQGPSGESGVTYQRGPPGCCGYPDQLYIFGGGTDIRNAAGTDYNPTPGLDATLTVKMRITDMFNGPDLNVPATMADFELGLPVGCVPDTEYDFGSTCAAGASTEAFIPEALRPGRHAVVQLFEVQMKDVGLDGVRGNADDRSFVFQGVSIP